ncbi:hypothetical protein F5148DRAFT_1288743 [Russula earlei]|uniref:Uncharacterized protein n=1 Tax=Russula earlei TaxID=71964 RepID=A0ACC0TZ91_9AGAM|nr:hypothetical protein F5148DRAFT_1288743 [Russula earlei]
MAHQVANYRSWDNFKKAFTNHFIPAEVELTSANTMQTYHQDKLPFNEWYQKWSHRSMNLPLLLDLSVATTRGTVLPQRRWIPADEVDVRRYESPVLQLPIFFIDSHGGGGFWLSDILHNRDHNLHNADSEASLGGGTTVHIRINWPGYGDWKRQIQNETHLRKSITLARFMKLVGASVEMFLNQWMASGHVVDTRWGIGMQGITQSHVKIIGAMHVSTHAWMPIIQFTWYVL